MIRSISGSSRKLRKARIRRLSLKFIDWTTHCTIKSSVDPIGNMMVNESVDMMVDEFARFCAFEKIDTPQLKSTRDAIIFEIDNILNEKTKTKTKEVL